MSLSNRLVSALLVFGALTSQSSASAQSFMKSNATFEQAVNAESVVVAERGLAPLTGGELPAACKTKFDALKNPTNAQSLRYGSGYQAGLCEAEEMARDNLRRAISAIIARRAGGGAPDQTDAELETKVSEVMAAARVTRRKLWLDRRLAEVEMQVTLDQSPRTFAR